MIKSDSTCITHERLRLKSLMPPNFSREPDQMLGIPTLTWGRTVAQELRKTIWAYLLKPNVRLFYEAETPFPHIYTREKWMYVSPKKAYQETFIVASFPAPPCEEFNYSSPSKWINELRHVCIVGKYFPRLGREPERPLGVPRGWCWVVWWTLQGLSEYLEGIPSYGLCAWRDETKVKLWKTDSNTSISCSEPLQWFPFTAMPTNFIW